MFSKWDFVCGLGLVVLLASAYALAPQACGMVAGALLAGLGGMRAIR